MRLKTLLTTMFVLIALIPIVFVGIFGYYNAQEILITATHNALDGVSEHQSARIEDFVSRHLGRLDQFNSRTLLKDGIALHLSKNASLDRTIVSLEETKNAVPEIDEISIVDVHGRTIASSNHALIGTPYPSQEHVRKGLERNTISDVFRDADDRTKIILAGPLTQDNRPIGVTIIKIFTTALETITEDHTGLGATGETTIAQRMPDGTAVYIVPLRFDPDAAIRRSIGADEETVMALALEGNEGLHKDTLDYRGNNVLAATRHINRTGWGVVVKIDADEAFAPINTLKRFTYIIALVTALIGIVIGIIVSRQISRPIIELQNVAEELSKGRIDVQIPTHLKESDDEIGSLARAFDRTLVSLKLAIQKIGKQQPREESIGKKKKAPSDGLAQGLGLDK